MKDLILQEINNILVERVNLRPATAGSNKSNIFIRRSTNLNKGSFPSQLKEQSLPPRADAGAGGPPPRADAGAGGPPPRADVGAGGPPPRADVGADKTPPVAPSKPKKRKWNYNCPDNNLHFGCRGKNVEDLQKKIIDNGISLLIGADGKFGKNTKNALLQYQQRIGASQSGVYDDQTISKESSSTVSKQKDKHVDSSPAVSKKEDKHVDSSGSGQGESSKDGGDGFNKPANGDPSTPKASTASATKKPTINEIEKTLKDLRRDFYSSGYVYRDNIDNFMEIPNSFVLYLISTGTAPQEAVNKAKQVFGSEGKDYLKAIHPVIKRSNYDQIKEKIQEITGISFSRLLNLKRSDMFPELYQESKIQKNYFIDTIRNRNDNVQKLVFERLVKGCK